MTKYIIKNKAGSCLSRNYLWVKFISIDASDLHDLDTIKLLELKDKPVEAFEVKILRAPTGEVKTL